MLLIITLIAVVLGAVLSKLHCEESSVTYFTISAFRSAQNGTLCLSLLKKEEKQ